jgi:hypothetical protein
LFGIHIKFVALTLILTPYSKNHKYGSTSI